MVVEITLDSKEIREYPVLSSEIRTGLIEKWSSIHTNVMLRTVMEM